VREARLAVHPNCYKASGHSHWGFGGFERGRVSRRILFNKFRWCCGPIEPMRVRIMAASFDLGKLLLTLEILVLRLKK
jgi:hypothetical protein